MDFCYVTERAKDLILHIVDAATVFSATLLSDSMFIFEAINPWSLLGLTNLELRPTYQPMPSFLKHSRQS